MQVPVPRVAAEHEHWCPIAASGRRPRPCNPVAVSVSDPRTTDVHRRDVHRREVHGRRRRLASLVCPRHPALYAWCGWPPRRPQPGGALATWSRCEMAATPGPLVQPQRVSGWHSAELHAPGHSKGAGASREPTYRSSVYARHHQFPSKRALPVAATRLGARSVRHRPPVTLAHACVPVLQHACGPELPSHVCNESAHVAGVLPCSLVFEEETIWCRMPPARRLAMPRPVTRWRQRQLRLCPRLSSRGMRRSHPSPTWSARQCQWRRTQRSR